jgi:spoIIIJ-associated protein
MLDIAGYRAGRRADVTEKARSAAAQVSTSGEAASLPAMTAFERKVVHDVVVDLAGVTSESEGEEPHRRVVIRPA